MENKGKTKIPSPGEIRRMFEKILSDHVERLIGNNSSNHLPLNLTMLAVLTLCSEQERQIKIASKGETKRYSPETLQAEIIGLGIDPDNEFASVLKDMIKKEYLHIDAFGKCLPTELATGMCQIFDQAFPKMPGISLIAYLIQTIDEVTSGRKDLDWAASQVNQVLHIQGISLKPKRDTAGSKKSKRPFTRYGMNVGEKLKIPVESPSERRLFSSRKVIRYHEQKNIEIRELSCWQNKSIKPSVLSETIGTQISGEIDQNTAPEGERFANPPLRIKPSHQAVPDSSSETKQERPNPELPTDYSVIPSSRKPAIAREETPFMVKIQQKEEVPTRYSEQPQKAAFADKLRDLDKEKSEIKPEKPLEQNPASHDDDVIDNRISALEDDLALQCPMCRKYGIETEQTSTGRIYYKCPNNNCSFISWGKPYHLSCHQCGNPFLIEACDKNGKLILKCPRATCHYKQPLPGEKDTENANDRVFPETVLPDKQQLRRKIVRKRVLRKKGKSSMVHPLE